jgi:hypothetical protein
VQNQPQLAFETDRDALADPPQLFDRLPFCRLYGWRRRAQQKRARHAHALQPRAAYPRLQRLNVHRNIRQLRHAGASFVAAILYRHFAFNGVAILHRHFGA